MAHTEETKEKIRQARTGQRHSDETRRKIGESHRGKVVSEETRQAIARVKTGAIDSAETRVRKSEAAKARWAAYRIAAIEDAIKRIDAALKHFEQR